MDKENLTTGTKFDTGKTRIDLFPGDVLFAISDILTFGANKYADRNWENGMQWGRVFGALMRHMWSWWQGQGPTNKSFVFGDLDEETKRSHLWHAGCCITFLIAYEMRGVGQDDRPVAAKPEQKEEVKIEHETNSRGSEARLERASDSMVKCGLSDLQADLRSGAITYGGYGTWINRSDGRVVRYDQSGNRLD